MAYNNLNEFISYLNNRTYQKERRYGQDVSVSIFFEKDDEKQQLVDHKGRENVSNIRNLIKFNPFDKIHVDLHENDKTVSFSFDAKSSQGQELNIKNSPQQELTTLPDMPGQKLTGFTGFEQAEVEEIVGKRIAEEKTRMELVSLRETVDQRDKKIEKLKQKIIDLKGVLDKSKDETDELNGLVSSHRSIDHAFNNVSKVISELKETKLGQSLSGFLGSYQNQIKGASEDQVQQQDNDESGIVEEESSNPNDTVISMINEFLKRTNKETLALIYEILVYVENDPINAAHMYTYLTENIKLKKDANLRIQSQDTSQ
ncbi:MAG: hypothetical protein HN600_05155 [Bacteroidetes bacterium]|nr:hypothetical protein [Bacteroidota bacterium]MBT7993589.1 hypothetical protein [Bacteroidota bacterium]